MASFLRQEVRCHFIYWVDGTVHYVTGVDDEDDERYRYEIDDHVVYDGHFLLRALPFHQADPLRLQSLCYKHVRQGAADFLKISIGGTFSRRRRVITLHVQRYGLAAGRPDAGLQFDGFRSSDVFEVFRRLLEDEVRHFNLPGMLIKVLCPSLFSKFLSFFVVYLPHTKIFVFNTDFFGFYYAGSMILMMLEAEWHVNLVRGCKKYWKEQFLGKKVRKLQELAYKAFENEVFPTRLVYFLNHTLNLKGLYISVAEVKHGKSWRLYQCLMKEVKRCYLSPISLAEFVVDIVKNYIYQCFEGRVKMYCLGPHLFAALCKLLKACHRLVHVQRLDVWRVLIVVPQSYSEAGPLFSTQIVLINHEPADSLKFFEYDYTAALAYLQEHLPNVH